MLKKLTILILVALVVPIMGAAATMEELDLPDTYKRSLPILELDGIDLPLVRAINVVDYLQLLGGGCSLNSLARDNYVSYVESHMRTGAPIQFVILGFPCKSTNADKKVLSHRFDMADYLGLVRLEHIAEQIQSFVGVSCEIHIINKEPYIPEMFEAVRRELGVSLLNPNEYERDFLRLLGTCPHLRCGLDLSRDYLTEKRKEAYHTQEAIAQYVVAAEGLKGFFAGELDCSTVNDALKGKSIVSKAAIEKERRRLGLLMSQVYQLGVTVFRDVVKTHATYGSMLRLSVHGDDTKVMINFASTPGIASGRTCVPWHAALLCNRSGDTSSLELVRSADAPTGARIATMSVAGIALPYILM
jgi:hypothetical protein